MSNEVSLRVFQDNLRRILMMAPLTIKTSISEASLSCSQSEDSTLLLGKNCSGDRIPVLGFDPGYRCGCKWAACDARGEVLSTGVVFLSSGSTKPPSECRGAAEFITAITTNRISTIALGSGSGYREAEKWLNELIKLGSFGSLKVRYSMVVEDGASIYSASPLAAKELPNLDVTIRSA
ncbi:S1 RNA binding domain 1, partial [Cichlidogyrus casuarinus]